MEGGLVCQYLETEPSGNSLVVHSPIGSKELPTTPMHLTFRAVPALDMVVDSISQNFKNFLINHKFGLNGPADTPLEERLKIWNDPLLRVYDSATNEWQGSTNPSCVSWYGKFVEFSNGNTVEFQGLLHVIFSKMPPHQKPLYKYNLVEDAWENLHVRIPYSLRNPEMIASASPLFLAGWFVKHIMYKKTKSKAD